MRFLEILDSLSAKLAHGVSLNIRILKFFGGKQVLNGFSVDVIKNSFFFEFVDLLEFKILTPILIMMKLHRNNRLFINKHSILHLGQRKFLLILRLILQIL